MRFPATTMLTAALLMPTTLPAQESDVRAVIDRMFDGMRRRDSAMVRSVFHPEARLASVSDGTIHPDGIDGFVAAVGRSSDEQWNEPIWNVEIRIDGDLAQVWARYAFFRGPDGNRFSHCGVDTFELVRTADGWKIFHLADTRQREACEMPPGH